MGDDVEREHQLAHLEYLKGMGEKAYDEMYEVHSASGATAFYSDAKENFYDAIGLAERLGLKDEAETLTKRLVHIRAVFRSQFS